jgi:ribosomal protein L11 methyltransferase
MHELVLSTDADLVEPVSDALTNDLEALSVAVEDADVDTDAEMALFGEPGQPASHVGWQHSTLRAMFTDEDKAIAAATLLLAQEWAANKVRLRALRAVPAQDWVRLTQAQFAPVAITPTFWIVPSWHQAPAEAQRVIRLDPGMAFGTGTHPTTRMCLRWIANHAQAWPRVLDYGCGSGILAIGAALHGAHRVEAFDIDPAAISATRANASANCVPVHTLSPGQGGGSYELILANILAKPLVLLAPLLGAQVAAGGHLILAGILERQVDELRFAYAPWLALSVHAREEGWVLLTGRRVDGRKRGMP